MTQTRSISHTEFNFAVIFWEESAPGVFHRLVLERGPNPPRGNADSSGERVCSSPGGRRVSSQIKKRFEVVLVFFFSKKSLWNFQIIWWKLCRFFFFLKK